MNPPERERPYTDTSGTPGVVERVADERAAEPAAEDAELLRRMGQGDDRALGLFYDRWAPAVLGLALQMLRDREEAEETVEETFWQAWRQAARYDRSRGAPATWLLVIARSRALDRLRARRRRREEPLPPSDALDALAASDADDGADVAEMGERRRLVRGALETLPPEQREVLELAYFGGLSQTEIAERTGQPLGTVKTRVRLAVQKLRERLSVLREGR